MMTHTFEGWAVVEIIGCGVRAGRVTMDDSQIIRIDVPVKDGDKMLCLIEYYGRAAVHSMIPCTEEAANKMAAKYLDRLLRSGAEFSRVEIQGDGSLLQHYCQVGKP